jgi:hypothetical protein
MAKKAPTPKSPKKAAAKSSAGKAAPKRAAASKYDQPGAPWWKKMI